MTHAHDTTCAGTACPACGCCTDDFREPCGCTADPNRCGSPDADFYLRVEQERQ